MAKKRGLKYPTFTAPKPKYGEWEDTSSYSRGDTERIPSCWTIRFGGLSLDVHRHIHYPPEQWLASCDPFFACLEVGTGTDTEAKAEALLALDARLETVREHIAKAGVP